MATKEMFWLTGHTQAGTTLLQKLFDAHPDCATYPVEPYFYRLFPKEQFACPDDLKRKFLFHLSNRMHLSERFAIGGNREAWLEKENLFLAYETASRSRCRKGSTKRGGLDEVFHKSYYFNLHNEIHAIPGIAPRKYVEAAFAAFRAASAEAMPQFRLGPHDTFKHPCGRLRPDTFDWFFDNWPEGKAVFLTRNPFARIWSHMEHARKKKGACLRHSEDANAFNSVAKTYATDYVAAASLEQSRSVLKVNYEDLVTKPEATLRHICGFLGIDFSASLLKPTRLGCDDDVSTNRTGAKGINTNSLHRWKSNLSRKEQAIIHACVLRARARKIYRPAKYRINVS
ncbi:sulfotransferase [Roseibium sp. MMSF_3412]|uniref:sulfotransferase n=1 Tax=Roseibium sp. MMSF_3412 TaxID=3046712 RepID=UPI00273E0AE0|nr:sulfotransferase [Roseibium sp. MMSF_3412]